eukprot:symbB.v1.2.008375.t1/scaffold521.1/size192847/7
MSNQWTTRKWQNQGGQKHPGQQQKGSGKGKKDTKKDGAAQALPSYDGGSSSSSAGQQSQNSISTDQVLNILQKYAGKDKELAAEVSALLPEDMAEREEIKAKQKHLNQLRKVQTRISKKEQLLKDKDQQMAAFLIEMKRHLEQEKIRHKQESEAIQQEIQELREQMQKIKDGKVDETEEQSMDIEEILEGQDPEKEQLRLQLDKSEKEKQQMQHQLQQLQDQMMEFMANYNPQARGASPNMPPHTPMAFTPEQGVKAPQTLPVKSEEETEMKKKRDALQPFGVAARTARPSPVRTSPYDKTEKPTEKEQTQEEALVAMVNLESPDR